MTKHRINRKCAFCKKEFYSKHKHVTHCSIACYHAKNNNRTLEERLFSLIEKTDYCWLWKGNITPAGYGRIYFQGKFHQVHRLMYELANKRAIPIGYVVRHFICDNPPCCNPAHLRIGTQADNSQDAVKKQRHAHGETSYAKLTEQDVLKIRQDNRKATEIAKDYGVARKTISHIKNRTTWKHLP